jgi:hypothetical protein
LADILQEFSFDLAVQIPDILEEIRQYVDERDSQELADRAIQTRAYSGDLSALTPGRLVQFLPHVSAAVRERIITHLISRWSGGQGDLSIPSIYKHVQVLPEEPKRQLLQGVKGMNWEYVRLCFLATLLRLENTDDQMKTTREILACVSTYRNTGKLLDGDVLLMELVHSAPFLPLPLRLEILAEVLRMDDHKYRLKALTPLLSSLPANEQDQAVMQSLEAAAKTDIRHMSVLTAFWSAAAEVLSAQRLEQVLYRLRQLEDEGVCLFGTQRQFGFLESKERARHLDYCLKTIACLPIRERCFFVLSVCEFFDDDQVRRLTKTLEEWPPLPVVQVATRLISRTQNPVTTAMLAEIIDKAEHALRESEEQAEARIHILNAFPSRRSQEAQAECLAALDGIKHFTKRVEIAVLLQDWGGGQPGELIPNLTRQRLKERGVVRRDSLKVLAKRMPFEVAYDTAAGLLAPGDSLEQEALPNVLARLAELGHRCAVCRGLLLPDSPLKSQSMIETIPHLCSEDLNPVLRYARTIENDYFRDQYFAALCLRAAKLGKAHDFSDLVKEISRPELYAASCAVLVPGVSAELRTKLTTAALKVLNRCTSPLRVEPIEHIAESLSNCAASADAARTALIAILELISREARSASAPQLHALAPLVVTVVGPQGLPKLNDSFRRVIRWWS